MRNDDIGAESDKFLGVLLGTIASCVGIAKLDLDVFTIRVAEGVQTAPECVGERMRRRRGHQHSNKGEFSWSLCARSERPRRRRASCKRDEVAPSHGAPFGPTTVPYHNARRWMLCRSVMSGFGSKADILGGLRDVRSTPESGHRLSALALFGSKEREW